MVLHSIETLSLTTYDNEMHSLTTGQNYVYGILLHRIMHKIISYLRGKHELESLSGDVCKICQHKQNIENTFRRIYDRIIMSSHCHR